MSYAKGCKNESYVKIIAAGLKADGFNVSIDGGSIGRRLNERKIEALEDAAVIIICVSKKYHELANEEANYAKGLEKIGQASVLFTMLDETYTTESQPFRVSGWLGNMVFGTTWYPCWTKFQAQSTAVEIASNIMRTVDLKVINQLRGKGK
jgi:hypothetical protein